MYFKYIRYVVISFLLIWVSACSSKGGGESSTNTLLDENTPPVAYDQNITLSKIELMENGELDIVLEAVDSDGDSLIYTILQYPKHGSLSGDMPDVIYIPESNYVGEDSFVFEVSDGISTSKGVVNIIILSQGTSSDTPPKTQTQDHNETKPQDTNSSDNNTTTTIQPPEVKDPQIPQDDNVSEPDKDENSTSIIPPKAQDDNTTTPNKPSDHNVTIPHTPQDTNSSDNNTTTTIKPPEVKDPEVPQDDNVSEPNKDENSTSVNNSNHMPIAKSKSFIMDKNTQVEILLEGSDEDNDTLIYALKVQPAYGTLKGSLPNLVYTPNKDYVGKDSFSYIVNDGIVNSNIALVTIDILPTNEIPIAHNDVCKLQEDTNETIDVLANDIDKDDGLDKNSLNIIKQPIHGTLKILNDKVVYQPYKNYFGKDGFSYTIKDKSGALSNEAIVDITILPVNDAPVAVDDNVTLDNQKAVSIDVLKNDFDIDSDKTALKVVSISKPKYGKSSISSNFVLYSNTQDDIKLDSFSYSIEDESGNRSTATVYIQIYQDTNSSNTNKAPIAYDKYIQINEDETISFELNATDADQDKLQYILTNSSVLPSHGVIVTQDNHMITYKPNQEFFGKDYITFVANDGKYNSNQAIVTINIVPTNDAPIANAGDDKQGVTGDSFVLDGSKSYDIDGEIVSYEWIEGNQTISTQPTFSKLFTTEGVHRISLRVTDDKNATGMDEVVVDIGLCNQGCIHPDPTQTVPFQ